MFVFVLQLRHAFIESAHLYLFAVFSVLVWMLWVLKVALSRRYQPWTAPHQTSTSVVIPVVDEPVEVFRAVLDRITDQHPTETIVVINGPRNSDLEVVCQQFAHRGVQWTWTPTAGKRHAVSIGAARATGEILVLVDSDTVWTDAVLTELVKPFADPQVGGVTTRQRVLDPTRTFITRWMDWVENSRARYSMPAQSVLGQVGCLPGRTIAFRRSIVMAGMEEFLNERFLGVFLEVSDDRTLTNLTLKQGYRTVYQATSLVYTDAPVSWGKLYKQQLRWARGSQYNTLRMLPWMLRNARMLALFFLTDMALPFLLLASVAGGLYRVTTGTGPNYYAGALANYGTVRGVAFVAVLTAAGSCMSMMLRNIRLLQERPTDLLWMPLYLLFSTLFLMPIRVLGFLGMAHAAGWGTRVNAYPGGESDAGALATEGARPGLHRRTARRRPVPRTAWAHVQAVKTNPTLTVPYLLACTALTAAAAYGG